MSKIFVPKESFVTPITDENGVMMEQNFREGRTTVEEGHPLLHGREHLFRELRLDYPAPRKVKAA